MVRTSQAFERNRLEVIGSIRAKIRALARKALEGRVVTKDEEIASLKDSVKDLLKQVNARDGAMADANRVIWDLRARIDTLEAALRDAEIEIGVRAALPGARLEAAKVGPMHALWDTISRAEAALDNQPPAVRDRMTVLRDCWPSLQPYRK